MLAIGGLTLIAVAAAVIAYAVKYRNVRDLVILTTTLSVIVLLRASQYLGSPTLLTAGTIVLLVGAARLAATHGTRVTWNGAAVLAFAGIMAATVVRGALNDVYSTVVDAMLTGCLYVTVAFFAMTVVAHAETEEIRFRRLVAIALAPTVFVGTAVLLYAAGFQATITEGVAVGEVATIPQLIGVTVERVQFPLGGSVNTMGIIAAVSLTSCLALASKRAVSWKVTVPGTLVSVYALALSDTRAALIIALAVAAWLAFSKRTVGTRAIAVTIPLLPLLMMWLIALNENGPVGRLLSRDTGDFATGNGRVEIWEGAWQTVGQVTPTHLFGWGANGQATSGAWMDYRSVFAGREDPWMFTTHDIALQMVLDAGIVGLALLVLVVVVAAGPLQRSAGPGRPESALLGIIAVAVLCGVTEVSPSYGSGETLLAMLMATGAAVALPAGAAVHAKAPVQAPRAARSAPVS